MGEDIRSEGGGYMWVYAVRYNAKHGCEAKHVASWSRQGPEAKRPIRHTGDPTPHYPTFACGRDMSRTPAIKRRRSPHRKDSWVRSAENNELTFHRGESAILPELP